jgi:hypothetical protein
MPNDENKNGKRKISIFEYLVVGAGAVAVWETAKTFASRPRRRRSREDRELDEDLGDFE